MPDPPGATGDLGLDLLQEPKRRIGELEAQARALEATAPQPMRQRFQPMREALERHAFYANLLERACDDAATNVRTNYVLWKTAGAYRTDAEILTGILAELVIGFALDSPMIQKQVSELIGRTLSLADRKGRRLAVGDVLAQERRAIGAERRGQRATAEEARRRLSDMRNEAAAIRERARGERDLIAEYLAQLKPIEEVDFFVERLIREDLAAALNVPVKDLDGLRSVDAIVEAVERHRGLPRAQLEGDLLTQEGLAREAELAVEASTQAIASGRPRSERALAALSKLDDPAKHLTQEEYLEFAKGATMELRAMTKARLAAAKTTPKPPAKTTPEPTEKSTPEPTEVDLDSGGRQSDPMLAVLDRVVGAAQQQVSAYQELVLRTRLHVDDLLELRALPGLQTAADEGLADVATLVNGLPAASASIGPSAVKFAVPGYNVGAGQYRAAVAYEVELMLWALVLAPLIREHVPNDPMPQEIGDGIPKVALDYVAARFASKLTDKVLFGAGEVPSISAADPLGARTLAPEYWDSVHGRVSLLLVRIHSAWQRLEREAGFEPVKLPYLTWFRRVPGRAP
jgi:hypothetical protein